MFKIARSLRLIDIISKSWYLNHGCNLRLQFKKYEYWQISHCFDQLVLLTSIPSETLILS